MRRIIGAMLVAGVLVLCACGRSDDGPTYGQGLIDRCRSERTDVFLAIEVFKMRRDGPPVSVEELRENDEFLASTPEFWTVKEGELAPMDGSDIDGCTNSSA